MIYAITNVTTWAFEGLYDTSYGDMTPNEHFIEIDNTKRDDLIANPLQYWDGNSWEPIAPSLPQLKDLKLKELNELYADAHTFNWEHDGDTGSGWVTPLERLIFWRTTNVIGNPLIYFVGRDITITNGSAFIDVLDDLEEYEYDLDNWYRAKVKLINAAADETILNAIYLPDGQPTVKTVDLDI